MDFEPTKDPRFKIFTNSEPTPDPEAFSMETHRTLRKRVDRMKEHFKKGNLVMFRQERDSYIQTIGELIELSWNTPHQPNDDNDPTPAA